MEWKVSGMKVMVRDRNGNVLIVTKDSGTTEDLANTLKQHCGIHNINNAHDSSLVLHAELMGKDVTLL